VTNIAVFTATHPTLRILRVPTISIAAYLPRQRTALFSTRLQPGQEDQAVELIQQLIEEPASGA
jgi:hypothetical protein